MSTDLQLRQESGLQIALDGSRFGAMLTLADRLAKSKLVPAQFRDAPEDVYLALDMAERLQMNPLMVMQNLYVVQGKPAWSSQFVIACVNASRRYTPLRFRVQRDKDGKIIACQCVANDRETGEELTGTTITAEMVRDEGWESKPGSKWKTMPEQMYRYRAAAFFARANCPEVTMGIYSADEVREFSEPEEDVVEVKPRKARQIKATYEPSQEVTSYAVRIRQAPNKNTLQAVKLEIKDDATLNDEDKDFLRPLAVAKGKELQ